jgi:hypothetical protein
VVFLICCKRKLSVVPVKNKLYLKYDLIKKLEGKKMKKVLCFALSFILVFGTLVFPVGVSATGSSTDTTYSYIRTNSFAQVFESTGTSEIYEGQILFKPAATLSFQFDMKDDVQNAVFNFYGGNTAIKVEVKADGESSFTELTAKGSLLDVTDRGTIPYTLTSADALKSANKKFVVRVTNSGGGDGLIYATSVNAFAKEILNYITVGALTENELKYTVENNVVSRYINGTTPNLRLPYSSSYVIYKFNLENSLNSLSYNVETIGSDAVKVQISSDKVNWTDLAGLSGDISANVTGLADKTFYLKCFPDPSSAGSSTNKQSYITNLSLYAGYELSYAYTPTDSFVPVIEKTGASQIYNEYSNNTILLSSGSTISVQFNIRDDIQNAVLNLYGGNSAMKVEVKADGESNYTELVAKGSVFSGGGRGITPYNLTTNDALKAANNKFIVRVTNTGTGQAVINSLSVNAFDKESATSIKMNAFTESELKYTVENSIVNLYINNGTPGIQFKTKDSYVIYKFNLKNDINALTYNIETFGTDTVLVQFSSDMVNWTNLSGLSGDIYSNISGLADKVFYMKCMSDPNTPSPTDNQAFVTNVALTAGYANSVADPVSFGTHKISGTKISNIVVGSTVTDFLVGVNVRSDTTLVVRNSSDTATLVTDNPVGTGTIVKVTTGDVTTQYTMVIYGDVTGDGKINLSDLVSIRNNILGVGDIQGNYKSAGDLYDENNITLNGLVGVMSYVSQAGTINQNP